MFRLGSHHYNDQSYPSIPNDVSNVCIEVSQKRIVDSLTLTFAEHHCLIVRYEFLAQCTCVWVLYAVSNTGNGLPTSTSACTLYSISLIERSIHQHNLPAEDCKYPSLGKFLLVQRRSRRILASCSYTSFELEPRRLVHEMLTTSRDYRLTLSTSGCSFHVCEVILQILITSLWEDPVRMVFKPPTVETLCAVPIRLSRCVTFATWVSTVADFSNEPSA